MLCIKGTPITPGTRVDVRYASSSPHGGTYTDTVAVKAVEGDLIVSTNGYRYHKDTVVKVH